MSADGTAPTPHEIRAARSGWTPEDCATLERVYPIGGSRAASAAMPWRSPSACRTQASFMQLRAPVDPSVRNTRMHAAQLKRAAQQQAVRQAATAVLDTPLSPRETVRIILGAAGAPMLPAAVADRLKLPRWEIAALLNDMLEQGDIIIATVADRTGLITLAQMPDPVEEPARAPRHHAVRKAAANRIAEHTGRLTRASVPARSRILAALRSGPKSIDQLAELAGIRYSTVRAHLRELSASTAGRSPAVNPATGRPRQVHLYEIPKGQKA